MNGFWFKVQGSRLGGLRRLSFVICLGLLVLTPALLADTVELKSGQKFDGMILGFDGQKITVRATVGGGTAELSQPLELVSKIDFSLTPEETRLVSAPTANDVPALEALWKKREPYLALPGSDALNVALQYGHALVQKGTKTAGKDALALCNRFEKTAPAPFNDGFRSLRLTALILTGDTEAAAAEAAKMTEVGAENISAFIEAKYITAQASAAKIKALEADHPRWSEERDQARERRRLYDDALDNYLYPVVFQPDQTAKAARGLWSAADLYLANDDKPHAAVCADEIVRQFPDPEYVSRAQDLLKKTGPPPAIEVPPLPEVKAVAPRKETASSSSTPSPTSSPSQPTPTPFHKHKKKKENP